MSICCPDKSRPVGNIENNLKFILMFFLALISWDKCHSKNDLGFLPGEDNM